jgi:hypothetical protein
MENLFSKPFSFLKKEETKMEIFRDRRETTFVEVRLINRT